MRAGDAGRILSAEAAFMLLRSESAKYTRQFANFRLPVARLHQRTGSAGLLILALTSVTLEISPLKLENRPAGELEETVKPLMV